MMTCAVKEGVQIESGNDHRGRHVSRGLREILRRVLSDHEAFLAKHQGTTLRRQLIKKTLYGTHAPSLIMVIDFPTEELAESLFFEQEYLDVIPLRDRIFADFRMYLAEYGNV
jgi:uncharacterized protein (DUF1330 family)